MKCLLVFAVALAAVRAEEMKVVKPVLTYAATPLAYNYPVANQYYSPVVYNTHKVVTPVAAPVKEVTYEYQPVQTKYVAKPYDVEVKSFEPELVKTLCKNNKGFHVPCRQKRDTTVVAAAAPSVHHSYIPTVYNTVPQVHDIEVPTPQLKKVVQKVPVQPLCTND